MRQILLSFLVLLLAAATVKADVTLSEAQLRAIKFVNDRTMTFVAQGEEVWGSSNGKPNKCYHFQGQRDKSLVVDVDATTGDIRYFFWGTKEEASQERLITQEQADSIAKAFIKNSTSIDLPALTFKGSLFIDKKFSGQIYQFTWQKYKNKVQLPVKVTLHISAKSGEVTALSDLEYELKIESLTPQVSANEAFLSLKEQKLVDQSGELMNSELSIVPPKGESFPSQILAWVLYVQTPYISPLPEFKSRRMQAIYRYVVDAKTDKLVTSQLGKVAAIGTTDGPIKPKGYIAVDFWPCWSSLNGDKSCIVFRSNRKAATPKPDLVRRQNPDNAAIRTKDDDNLLVMAEAGKLLAILNPPRQVFTLDVTRDLKVAFWMLREVYILDLKKESLERVNDGARAEKNFPCWDNTGRNLFMSGLHGQNPKYDPRDSDIFIYQTDELSPEVPVMEYRALAVFPGADNMPVFLNSPVPSVVFMQVADSPADKAKKIWNLYQLEMPDKVLTGQETATPHEILSDIGEVERISPFPDGKHILMSYSKDENQVRRLPDVIDIQSKTRAPLKFATLFDPDLPKGKPLEPIHLSVSPDGKQIAFSALRWSGDPKDDGAILIYTCNLDGTNLKRITPPTDVPLEPYQYPQEGVTGLNAWEKLLPKPNEGTGIKYGDFAARDKYVQELEKKHEEAKARADKTKRKPKRKNRNQTASNLSASRETLARKPTH